MFIYLFQFIFITMLENTVLGLKEEEIEALFLHVDYFGNYKRFDSGEIFLSPNNLENLVKDYCYYDGNKSSSWLINGIAGNISAHYNLFPKLTELLWQIYRRDLTQVAFSISEGKYENTEKFDEKVSCELSEVHKLSGTKYYELETKFDIEAQLNPKSDPDYFPLDKDPEYKLFGNFHYRNYIQGHLYKIRFLAFERCDGKKVDSFFDLRSKDISSLIESMEK